MSTVDVSYWEGWDAVRRDVVGPLPPDVVRQRDDLGDPYAVLLSTGGQPRAVLEVAWRHHSCVAWGLDSQLRRAVKRDVRRLDRSLVLAEEVSWWYADADSPEFGPSVWRRTVRHRVTGDLMATEGFPDRVPDSRRRVAVPGWRMPAPAFGDWAAIAFMGAHPKGRRSRRVSDRLKPLLPGSVTRKTPFVTRPETPPGQPLTGPLWHPPRPGRPDPRLVTGAEYLDSRLLPMPTGELVICDPSQLAEADPYTVRVPPGEYPVTVTVDRGRVAAARLTVRAGPVAAWEPATRPGDDVRLLPDGAAFSCTDELVPYRRAEFFTGHDVILDRTTLRTGILGGLVCFADAASVRGLADVSLPPDPEGPRTVEIGPAIAVRIGGGDGDCPVWVGRAANGDVVCFLVDLGALTDRDRDRTTDGFAVGDVVVVDRPTYTRCAGTVVEVDTERRTVVVRVSVFGARPAIECLFEQVIKR